MMKHTLHPFPKQQSISGDGVDVRIRNNEERTIFHKTENKSLELILAYGAEVNMVDSRGQTPLHTMIHRASKSVVGTIQLLLKNEANLATNMPIATHPFTWPH